MQFYLTNVSALSDRFEEGCELLTTSRRQRIEAIKNEKGRLQLMGGGLLLRRFLDVTDDRQLTIGEKGKPSLCSGPHFSLSHSGAWCALAIAEKELGADIEVPRSISPGMFSRCLTAAEQAWCDHDPIRFLQLWTRKESVMKACGIGIGMGLRNISALPEEIVTVCGRRWLTKTFKAEQCICSAAYESDFEPEIYVIPVHQLL